MGAGIVQLEHVMLVTAKIGHNVKSKDLIDIPLSYFSFQPVLHDWCNKLFCLWDDAYKKPLLLIRKGSPCSGSRFPLSLFEWSFIICLTPYNRK